MFLIRFNILSSLILFALPAFSEVPDCEVIRYSTWVDLKDNRQTEIDTIEFQVNRRNGENYTEYYLPYSKNEKVSDLNGWITDDNGRKIRTLKNTDITDQSAISDISLYEDDFVKIFQLKHNDYPYRIVYTFKTTCKQFIGQSWHPFINYQVPVQNATLTVNTPMNYSINKHTNNTLSFRTDTLTNSIQYRWTANYPKPIPVEPYSNRTEPLPHVIFMPLHFTYGVEGSTKSWKEFGNWQYRLIEKLDDLPESEKQTILSLIKGVSDKKEIVKILYHYMQDHTRYINVSIDIGGLKPYPASYVAQNKYGDCKALSNYMKSLLNYAGIKSYYTIIYANDLPREIYNDIPGEQFNHVILTVPVDKDTIWLENTDNTHPFGYISTFIQNRQALLIDKENSHLITIPSQKKADVTNTRNIEITINEDGNARARLKTIYKGNDFEIFNSIKSELNKEEQDKKISQKIFIGNFDIVNWELHKSNRDTANIELTSQINLSKVLKPLGNESYLNIFPSMLPTLTRLAERKLPVYFPYPISDIDTITYNIPKGYEVKSLPPNTKIPTDYGKYELSVSYNERTVVIIKNFDLFPAKWNLDKYPGLYNFIKAIKEAETRKIILKNIN